MKRVIEGNEIRTVRNNGKPLGTGPIGQPVQLGCGLFLVLMLVFMVIAMAGH